MTTTTDFVSSVIPAHDVHGTDPARYTIVRRKDIPPVPWEAFRTRVACIVWLNLAAVAVVLVLELLFTGILKTAEPAAYWLLAVGGLAQAAELVWLFTRRAPPDPRVAKVHANATLAYNLVLALALCWLAPAGDMVYNLLLLPPIIAAAVCFPLWVAIAFSLSAGLLSLFSIQLFTRGQAALSTWAWLAVSLVAATNLMVAVVVWFLNAVLREEFVRLRAVIRELERTRQQLVVEEKLAAVGRLAGGIAHEIRNPVAMISSSLDMAAADTTDPATRAEMSRVAREEARRLARLTDDFLAYARNKPPDLKPVPPAGVVGYVASLAKARAAEAGVRVRTDCPEGLAADVDEFQIHRAMLNLVTNAIDATPRDGTITVGAARDGAAAGAGGIAFYVEDDGPAIPPDAANRLFEPFFTTRAQGTGLGLPIARSIATAHGGDLVLSRNDPGAVRFTLHVPPRTAAAAVSGAAAGGAAWPAS